MQIGYDSGVVVLPFALFRTCHRTRSSVAIESSTDEWPVDPSPVWIDTPMCSFALICYNQWMFRTQEPDSTDRSLKDRLYGGPAR